MDELDSSLAQNLDQLDKMIGEVGDPAESSWDPIALGLQLAKLEYSHLDLETELAKFRHLCEKLEHLVPKKGKARERASALVRAFSGEFGFSGDNTNYYNPKNSFLNDVYIRRKGIPITLSLIFMGLARSVGIRSVGISFPGHFLVQILPSCPDEELLEGSDQIFVDTFEGSRLLSIDDCKMRLEEWTRGLVPFGKDVLRQAHPRDIVSRMLRNLRAIYTEKEDLARLYWVLSSLIRLCPVEKAEALKERGFLEARMGRFHAAVGDLRRHLEVADDPRKTEHVERILRYFELQKETMN